MASFSEFVSWLRLVWKHWQVNLTGGVIIAALFLWQITGKTVLASVYLIIASMTFIASTFFVWRDGHKRAVESENESSEIYADVILFWLKENCHTACSFTTDALVESLDLSHDKISRGLDLLEDKWKVIEQDHLGWRYSAASSTRLTGAPDLSR
ncbi:MAG TPA: hypothetical protein VN948_03735 [Terriglobales bacterium]|nr:hypothetical protein [Terriglobales bacterium]